MLLKKIRPAVEAEMGRQTSAVRTLADVRDVLMALRGSDAAEVKLQLSAINTVARAFRCAPEDLSADPAILREKLATMSAAMAGLTRGSWSSVRSRILKAMQRAEIEVMATRRTKPLSGDWASLYQAIPNNGSKASLGRLIGYLSDHQVSPGDVTDMVIEQFRRELTTTSMRGNPTTIVRAAIRGWNIAVTGVPGWPQHPLTPAARPVPGYVLAADRFVPSFQTSLASYLAYLKDPPEDDDAPLRGLRPITVRLREFQLRQIASALVHRGVPVEDITSVRVLAARESVDEICEFFIAHHGRPDTAQLSGLLSVLRPIARYHLQDRDLAEWIGRRLKRLMGRTKRFGMTEKNRRKLAVFRDPKHVSDLLLLPYRLLKRAESGTMPVKDAAILMRAAVALELEIMCPIRLQNLAEIDVDRDLVRSQTGKSAGVHLFIPGHRTKNGEDIELELPVQSVALIDLYLAKYRNQLILPEHRGHGPRNLFPRADGTAKVGKMLAHALCKVLLRELGITFNVHLFRHLGCFLYLKTHPGQIDVMRRVLGHSDGETTRRFYAFVEQSDAFRKFDAHVLNLRETALRPSGKAVIIRKRDQA